MSPVPVPASFKLSDVALAYCYSLDTSRDKFLLELRSRANNAVSGDEWGSTCFQDEPRGLGLVAADVFVGLADIRVGEDVCGGRHHGQRYKF